MDIFCTCFQQNTIQRRFCCQINNKSINQTCFPWCFISVAPAYMLPTSVWVMIIMMHLEWLASASSQIPLTTSHFEGVTNISEAVNNQNTPLLAYLGQIPLHHTLPRKGVNAQHLVNLDTLKRLAGKSQ